MPEEENDDLDENYTPAIDPPDWNKIDQVSNKIEKIFSEETFGLGVLELDMIMSRLNLVFEDYRMRLFMDAYVRHGDNTSTPPTCDQIYK